MTNVEFQNLLKKVFNKHLTMNKRDYHTVNELLHCLRFDEEFKGMNVNISIVKANDEYYCIPSLTAFVDINTLGIWFDDNTIEYEMEPIFGFGEEQETIDFITVYEKKEK